MFKELVRDFKISRNHRKRVNSIVIRSNEEIVRSLDRVRNQFLEAERKEVSNDVIKYGAQRQVLEWLISETK